MHILFNIKRHLPLFYFNLVFLLLFLINVVGIYHLPFIEQIENFTYDTRVIFSTTNEQDKRLVIVDIDEKSLAAEGRWPWGRDRLAALLDSLFDHYRVATVGFDVVFAEPDESSGLNILNKLEGTRFSRDPEYQEHIESIRQELDYDRIFAESIADRSVVLGFYFNEVHEDDENLQVGVLPEPVLTTGDLRGRRITVPVAGGYGANLAEFQSRAASAGHFNPGVDHLELMFPDEPSSSNQAIYNQFEYIGIGDRLIPVDEFSQALVPYRGKRGSYPYISAVEVINKTADASLLQGAVILIGTSAPGLFDLRSTPVQSKYPGVEVHANLIAGIIDQRVKAKPAYVNGVEFSMLLIVGILIAILMPQLSPILAAIFTLSFLVIVTGLNFIIWQFANLVVPLASTIMMILVLFLLNMSYGFFIERRRKSELTGLFGQYIPSELVEEMSEDPQAYSLEAENREMTVLFSDVRGFTSLSEGLDPKALSTLMNEFLTPLTHIIHDYRGTIDKYMGDAIMAFWGAPVKDPDHALHALQAGLAIAERIKTLSEEFSSKGWPELRIGVGINTGEMCVGNLGSEFRMAYTVMGDTVNLGSRLEALTKAYKVDLIVSESTFYALPDYRFRELDRVKVVGKDEPISIYEPICLKSETSRELRDELGVYEQALHYYCSKDWDMAELQFLNLKERHAERPLYDFYIERLNYFRNNPPDDNWDGVFTFTKK
jgi:adenylate cyclase